MIGLRVLLIALALGQAVFRSRGDVVEVVDNARRPVDVTLAVQMGDERIYRRADVAEAVGRIVATLGSADRVRVIMTDAGVRDATGWVAGGTRYTFGGFRAGFVGSVADAIVLAIAHQPAPGRGHLILGISN